MGCMISNKGTVHYQAWGQLKVWEISWRHWPITGQQPHWSGTTLDWNSVKGVQLYTQFTMSSGNQTWQWNREFSSVIFPIKTFKTCGGFSSHVWLPKGLLFDFHPCRRRKSAESRRIQSPSWHEQSSKHSKRLMVHDYHNPLWEMPIHQAV